MYVKQGLSEKALAIARRAQTLKPNTSTSLSQLSSLWAEMEQHDEALACAHKALECEERVYGKNSFHCAINQVQIGIEYGSLGQFDAALSWLQRDRATYEKNLT